MSGPGTDSCPVFRGEKEGCDLNQERLFDNLIKIEVAALSQQQVLGFVTNLLPSRRKTRRTLLALDIQGVIRRRRLTLSAVAGWMQGTCRIIHRVKRLWPFTNDSAVDPRDAVQALASRAFHLRPSGWLAVLMDETGMKERAMLLGAAIASRGRALPVALEWSDAPPTIRHRVRSACESG